MGVTRKVLKPGNEAEKPMKGDEIIVEYTGNLYDETKGPSNDFRGKEFDSSKGRGDFKILIGMGKVIKGWDEEILQMSLGEICILTITGDYAYGERGFPGLIPSNASLVFEIELKGINRKTA